MATTVDLTGDDLTARKTPTKTATRGRGTVPSSEFVPMNFKMPPDFVKRFKREALERDMKLNELFEAAFLAYVERGKKANDKN